MRWTNWESWKSLELSAPQAPRLIPVSTISFPLPRTNVWISSKISSIGRNLCRPRACTVRQKVQKLSHPVCTTIYFRVKICFRFLLRSERSFVCIIFSFLLRSLQNRSDLLVKPRFYLENFSIRDIFHKILDRPLHHEYFHNPRDRVFLILSRFWVFWARVWPTLPWRDPLPHTTR